MSQSEEISSIETTGDLNQMRSQLGDCHTMGLISGDTSNLIDGQLVDISKAAPVDRAHKLRKVRATVMIDCPMCQCVPLIQISRRHFEPSTESFHPMLQADFEEWSVESGFVTIPPGG